MNVIFLDIDGVLNCADTKEKEPRGCIGVEDDLAALLAEIVQETRAKIVLTSTWQQGWDPVSPDRSAQYLNQKLAAHGLKIADKTGKWQATDRGEGIRDWLKRNPHAKRWVVLDDEIYWDFEAQGIMPHLIQTDFYDGGLQPRHVKQAISMLSSRKAAA